MPGVGGASLVLILFSIGHELGGRLAGEEPGQFTERRGDNVYGGRPLSDRCFCLSSLLIHDLPALMPYLDGRCGPDLGVLNGVYNAQIRSGFYALYYGCRRQRAPSAAIVGKSSGGRTRSNTASRNFSQALGLRTDHPAEDL